MCNFYPRPPRGGRHRWRPRQGHDLHFYPRPPRGGRRLHRKRPARKQRFLSTPSARRATRHPAGRSGGSDISIHALREEGDKQRKRHSCPPQKFLSTPSARRATWLRYTRHGTPENFYPRPPRGGRRAQLLGLGIQLFISIHALREEGDSIKLARPNQETDFYPRPPRGGRRDRAAQPQRLHHFYPRPPRGGRRSTIPAMGWP